MLNEPFPKGIRIASHFAQHDKKDNILSKFWIDPLRNRKDRCGAEGVFRRKIPDQERVIGVLGAKPQGLTLNPNFSFNPISRFQKSI